MTVQVLRGPKLEPKTLIVKLGAFKGSAFSKLETEKPALKQRYDSNVQPQNIPLQDIAPAVELKLPSAE